MNLILVLKGTGLLHLGIMWAGATMPRTVGLGRHLAPLPPFIRRLVWVYYAFIGLTLAGSGAMTFFFAEEIAAGEPVARALCWFLFVFWTLRLAVAAFVFDVRPYLTTWYFRLGYHVTNVAFSLLVVVYAWAAWFGGTR